MAQTVGGGDSINSKAKGNRGENEVVALCHAHGFTEARRMQPVYEKGDVEHPDVGGLPGLHIECKRTERLHLYDAMGQAIRDADGKAMPVVMHRRNHSEWLAIMRAEDFLRLYSEWLSAEGV